MEFQYQECPALDPEKMLLNIDINMAQQLATKENQQTFAATVAVVGTVAAVGALASNSSNSKQEKNTNRISNSDAAVINSWGYLMQGAAITSAQAQNNYIFNTNNLQQIRNMWETMPIRKTHLEPNETMQGKVLYIPYEGQGNLRFFFPIQQTVIEVGFQQTLIFAPGQVPTTLQMPK
jgi:hypothetical protein